MDSFGECTIDRARRLVTRNGVPVHLSPKAYELLDLLIDLSPRVVARAELMNRLWPGTCVVEANLSNLVAEIRAALGDSPREPRWIRTAYNFGYGFMVQPRHVEAETEDLEPAFSFWLVHNNASFTLHEGDHLIGRHHKSVVPLHALTISRRHARIQVRNGQAILGDLGSRNGTFVGDAPVTQPIVLRDGDVIKVGDCLLRFGVSDLRHATAELQASGLIRKSGAVPDGALQDRSER